MRNLILIVFLYSFSGFSQLNHRLSLTNCDTIPFNLYQKKHLTYLEVVNAQGYCHSPIKVLSEKVENLKNLETLIFDGNDINSPLPSTIKNLKELKVLQTNDVIPEISELTQLKCLYLVIKDPNELADLMDLSFEKLVSLEQLSVSFSYLTIPSTPLPLFSELSKLKSLKKLYFFNSNQLLMQSLPPMESVTSLEFSGVKGPLNLDFAKFPNIDTLKISGVEDFSTLPTSIYSLKQLIKLSITNTSLETLGDGISNLVLLEDLDLGSNKITRLPNDLHQLVNLKYLSLDRNFNLGFIPENIGDLSNLERLIFSSCNIHHIPASIFKLKKLKLLYLKHNKIETLPEKWSSLQTLKTLHLSYNNIAWVPPGLFTLPALETLAIDHNQLGTANFKDRQQPMAGLVNLKKLDLQYNQLEKIPFDFGTLQKLEEVSLYNNRINELPPSIGDLKSLKYLSLSNNKIVSFPKELKNLKVNEFSCHTNPFPDAKSLSTNFPHANRVWIDEKFKDEIDTFPKLGKEVYYR